MSIVNFFFWIMMFLLGSLTWLLFDSFARREKAALAKLNQMNDINRRPIAYTVAPQSRMMNRSLGATVSASALQAGFYTVGQETETICSGASGTDDNRRHKTAEYCFELPHAVGYDPPQHSEDRTAIMSCPSCA